MKKWLLLLCIISLALGCSNPTETQSSQLNKNNASPASPVPTQIPISPSSSPPVSPVTVVSNSPTPTPSPTCSSPWNFTQQEMEWKIPEEKYVFIEHKVDMENIGLMIDFARYSFNKNSKVLLAIVPWNFNIRADKNLKVVLGVFASARGPGSSGWSSDAKGIYNLPYYDNPGINIMKVDPDGTVYILYTDDAKYKCHPLILKSGQEFKYVVVESPTIKDTHTITNYGIANKSRIKNYNEVNYNKNDYIPFVPQIPQSPVHSISFTSNPFPEGEKISFLSNNNEINSIYTMRLDGHMSTKILDIDDQWGPGLPIWSPDGKKMSFSREDKIYIMDSSGKLTELNKNSKISQNQQEWMNPYKILWRKNMPQSQPVWSLNQSKFVYEDSGDVYVMNTDGTNRIKLTDKLSALYPKWSPDGSKIVFAASNYGLYVINAYGSNLKKISDKINLDFPAWSPDGTKIVAQGNTVKLNEDWDTFLQDIYVMNADGSNKIKLTTSDINVNPVWSPDGKKIAFETDRDGNYEIYSMNADGSDQVNLTNNHAVDATPCWSPDGSKIAFSSNRDGNWEIYVMNADGSNQKRLTYSLANDMYPTWSR